MATFHLPTVMLSSLQNEINKMFDLNALSKNDTSNISTSEWSPTVDVKENKEHFAILADVPGIDPKDIHLNVENGILTIQGERKQQSEEKDVNYYRTERSYGAFYRRFSLPDTADFEHICAKNKNGVLEIIIPKIKKKMGHKIDIQVE